MHPLSYSIKDFEKLLKKKITLSYKNYQNELEEISGTLLYIHPTNQLEIMPNSITLDLGGERRNYNIGNIEKITYEIDD